jgi:uncharacterized protein YkwD
VRGRGFALVLAVTALLAPAQPAPAKRPCESKREAAKQVVCLINAERARRGLSALRVASKLRRAARRHARDMVRGGHRSHWSHGEGPLQRVAATGYLKGATRWTVGETLGTVRAGNGPAGLLARWMTSPGHRNILMSKRFREAGVGTAGGLPGGGEGYTVVVNVASRRG